MTQLFSDTHIDFSSCQVCDHTHRPKSSPDCTDGLYLWPHIQYIQTYPLLTCLTLQRTLLAMPRFIPNTRRFLPQHELIIQKCFDSLCVMHYLACQMSSTPFSGLNIQIRSPTLTLIS